MAALLETAGLSRSFGGIRAVENLSFTLPDGARQALIGPNGAGKTTFVNLLAGLLPATAGRIVLAGEDITRLAPEQRARRGLARTFQINQLFDELTPLETLVMTVLERDRRAGGLWRSVAAHDGAVAEAAELIARLGLADVAEVRTAAIAYGKRRQLEIAVALACRPRLLLLDEPAAGVPLGERQDIMATIAALPRSVTVLLIEHDMDLVFRFAERIAVLVGGRLLLDDTPAAVAADPRVQQAYLGEGFDEPA